VSAAPDYKIPEPDLDDWQTDIASQMEADNWDKLDEISKAKKETSLAIHKVFSWIIPIAIGLAFLMFSIVLGVYVAHLILPTNQRWLTADELQHIHNMLFSGVVGGAVAIGARTYFLDKD
jgi:hypothetical protein